MQTTEVNFDGLVGPTHHYAGLSVGNVASLKHGGQPANPRAAALQGLQKMYALSSHGLVQGVLPPLLRPNHGLLARIGFNGPVSNQIAQTAQTSVDLLRAAYSASAMWTANAATVSPSADTTDGKVHFTVANLNAKLHRSHEHEDTFHNLSQIFASPEHFVVHPALPAVSTFADEGAANHTRFAASYGQPGIEFFVFGRSEFIQLPHPARFPARQTLEAAQAVARLHGLNENRTVFTQQHPAAIDAGVFHNDVIAVGNLDTLFYHEKAFLYEEETLEALKMTAAALGFNLNTVRVSESDVPLADAVKSYLFNSQLLQRADGGMTLLVPDECRNTPSVRQYLDWLVNQNGVIREVISFDLQQSMQNGGGPACLRLRVVLTPEEQQAVSGRVFMNKPLFDDLNAWVNQHYREHLTPEDLKDPALVDEVRAAMLALQDILELPNLYPLATD